MATNASLISVVIPAFNAARFIRETLGSAQAQSYPHVEIIVVDDGSTDETADIVAAVAAEDARVQLIRQQNSGVAAARNAGIAASSGTYIAPLDADDQWYPDKLRLQIERIQREGPEVGVVYGDFDEVSEDGELIVQQEPHVLPEGWLADTLVVRNPIPSASTPLIRKAVLDIVGRYDTSMREAGCQGCEDWDLYLRLAEVTPFVVVPRPVVRYRKALGSMSSDPARMLCSYNIMMSRLLARNRSVSPTLIRRSRQHFHFYLAGIQRNRRQKGATAWHVLKGIISDPGIIVRKWPSRRAIGNIARMILD